MGTYYYKCNSLIEYQFLSRVNVHQSLPVECLRSTANTCCWRRGIYTLDTQRPPVCWADRIPDSFRWLNQRNAVVQKNRAPCPSEEQRRTVLKRRRFDIIVFLYWIMYSFSWLMIYKALHLYESCRLVKETRYRRNHKLLEDLPTYVRRRQHWC